MPHILDRTDENKTRKGRREKFKRGPGWFVYDGSETDTESIPQPKFMHNGKPDLDHNGKQKNGGPPLLKLIPIETYVLQGHEFPKGVPVRVELDALALKLRGMNAFVEVDEPKGKAKAKQLEA